MLPLLAFDSSSLNQTEAKRPRGDDVANEEAEDEEITPRRHRVNASEGGDDIGGEGGGDGGTMVQELESSDDEEGGGDGDTVVEELVERFSGQLEDPQALLPTTNKRNWTQADRNNSKHQTGIAILAYTNEMSGLLMAYEQNMINIAYFVANPSNEIFIDKMCPYLAFFTPLNMLEDFNNKLTSLRRMEFVSLHSDDIHINLVIDANGNNCSTRLLLTEQRLSSLTSYIHQRIKRYLMALYNIQSAFSPVDTVELQDGLSLVHHSLGRMSAAFKSGFEEIPVSQFDHDSMPIRLYRGMSNVPLNSSPSDVLCKLQHSYASWTKDYNVALKFAASVPVNDKSGVVLIFEPQNEARMVAIDTEVSLPLEWRCNNNFVRDEREVILPANTSYEPIDAWHFNSNNPPPRSVIFTTVSSNNPPPHRSVLVRIVSSEKPKVEWSTGTDPHWIVSGDDDR
jgi:hypothetical protein